MVRYNVHLTNGQIKKLQALSQKTGLLTSEIIRRAIDEYLLRQQAQQSQQETA